MKELSIHADLQLAKTDGGPGLALVDINRFGPASVHPLLDAALLALVTGWVAADPRSTADSGSAMRTLASVAKYDEPPNHLASLPPALMSRVAPELLRYVRNFHIVFSVAGNGRSPSITVTPTGFHGRRPKSTEKWIDPRTYKWKQRKTKLTHQQDLAMRTGDIPDVIYRWLLVNASDLEIVSHLNLIVRSLVDLFGANKLTADSYIPVCYGLAEREFPNGIAGLRTHDRSTSPAPGVGDTNEDEQQSFQRVLSTAQSEVLAEAIQADGVNAAEWGDDTMVFFGQFMRTLLAEATIAQEAYRDCGATDEELPYILILAGLRPALEKSGEALQELGASSEDLMRMVGSLAGPIQFAVDGHVRPDIFDAVQKRIYPELPS